MTARTQLEYRDSDSASESVNLQVNLTRNISERACWHCTTTVACFLGRCLLGGHGRLDIFPSRGINNSPFDVGDSNHDS